MYFGLSEDQIFFQDNVKKFLEDNAPLDVIRKIANEDDKTSKEDLHKGIITLGINNILIPEENGGLGLDLLFATAVSQSLGEGIATLPFTGSYVMAPIAIKYGANEEQRNFYLNEMSQIALRFGGTIDKFLGDALMIFFGDPDTNGPQEDARKCIQMALEMQKLMAEANLKKELMTLEFQMKMEKKKKKYYLMLMA